MIKVEFSVNLHDRDGDVIDSCILLHINDTIILKLNNLNELDGLINGLQNVKKEILENLLK
jgi:hypothetical protein